MLSDSSQIVNAFVNIGLGAIIAAVISALASRRKLGAEATQIITDAASQVVADLRHDRDDLRRDRDELRRLLKDALDRIEALEEREDKMEARDKSRSRAHRRHHEWDRLAVKIIRALVPPVHIDDPPPLDYVKKDNGDDDNHS